VLSTWWLQRGVALRQACLGVRASRALEDERQGEDLGARIGVGGQFGHQLGGVLRAVGAEQCRGRVQRVVVGQQVAVAGRTAGWLCPRIRELFDHEIRSHCFQGVQTSVALQK
jgi:hypothetical protein